MRYRSLSLPLWLVLAGAVAGCGERPLTTPPRSPAPAAFDASVNGAAPVATTSYTLVPAGEPFCTFAVGIADTGKGKMLVVGKAQGTTLFTSPGLKATLTNMETQKQATVNINGAFHVTVDEQGNTVYVVTGPNLLGDPFKGLVLAEGVFSFAYDAAGNLVQPLDGKGRLTNICTLLS